MDILTFFAITSNPIHILSCSSVHTMAKAPSIATSGSYSSLLNALRPTKAAEPPRKRRKVDHSRSQAAIALSTTKSGGLGSNGAIVESDPEDLEDVVEDVSDDEASVAVTDVDSDDEANLKDPFEQHFSAINAEELQVQIAQRSQPSTKVSSSTSSDSLRRTWIPRKESQVPPTSIRDSSNLHLKRRLQAKGSRLAASLSKDERDFAAAVFGYCDVLAGHRTSANSSTLREICVLHALNHSFKTRDRILKNTTKLAQNADEDLELRDQGFTRPKVLIVLPTKQSCVRFIDSIIKYSEPEQQENKARFVETYSREDTEEWSEKPADFQELFGGNHEEDFRIGLKFTRKTIKYFSGFYNSDIILCSPLGLFRAISSGGSADEKKAPDSDFLSSIEMMIVDHASALQMQNWQHVESAFTHLNAFPKEAHGCDYRRVREWYLEGLAKHLRQTIILSAYLTPEVNALASSHMLNVAGRVKYVPVYDGVMLDVANTMPIPISQTFVRFQSPLPLKDSDARFKYFSASVLPQLTKDKSSKGTLVFVATYADFTRLRNHLTNVTGGNSISFGSLSEYTSVKDTARARSYFLSGRNSLLLYTERAHHHFRYKIKGVQRVVFYGLPDNPVFWTEIVAMLGINRDLLDGSAGGGKGTVRAMFSRWDVLKLERVVGTDRVGRLVSESSGDTFDFV